MGTKAGRGVLLATVLGSGMTFLDGLVVNIALPRIDRDIDLGVSGVQWVIAGYLLTISAFLLIGGALGDLFGRRRVYEIGLLGFVTASVLCGLAQSAEMLIIARCLQGVAGALMVPASLAIIQDVFASDDRSTAIGAWTGYGTVFLALGPFIGGVFVTYVSWRWAFFINVPLGLVTFVVGRRYIPSTKAVGGIDAIDFLGALLCATSLGSLTFWAIESANSALPVRPWIIGVAGLVLLIAFVAHERRTSRPMMPTALFRSRQFNWINIYTVLFYGAFVSGTTLLGVQLQESLGYTPLAAAVATLPVSAMMIVLSKRFGALSQKTGPRLLMSAGGILVGIALAGMSRIHDGNHYPTVVLPCILLWGLGLSMVVAPLTSSALAAADQRFLGVASALNNAASRVGQAFAFSLIPVIAGIGGNTALSGPAFQHGYERALLIAAGLAALSAVIARLFVQAPSNTTP